MCLCVVAVSRYPVVGRCHHVHHVSPRSKLGHQYGQTLETQSTNEVR